MSEQFWILILTGLIAGAIDGIAGGGGLVTIPILALLIGPGATAIGTNKVAATCATLVALAVYARKGHVRFRSAIPFAVTVAVGSLLGSLTATSLSPEFYKWALVFILPTLLIVIWRRDLWLHVENRPRKPGWLIGLAAMSIGFYDGVAGPGGGTLMFLLLFLLAGQPLMVAIATSKLVNFFSGVTSLVSFTISGHVLWSAGIALALGISAGAFLGAHAALRDGPKYARIALSILVVVLTWRLALA